MALPFLRFTNFPAAPGEVIEGRMLRVAKLAKTEASQNFKKLAIRSG
jgi:hypothetical protein